MKYLVMETHPAYAVVLDEGGRFLKAANLHYQVGETVDEVIELRAAPPRRRFRPTWAGLAALAAAACLALGFFGYWRPNFTPYGSLRIRINPDVELSVSRTDRVLEVRGLNADGEALLDGLDLRGEDSDEAVEELIEEAIEKGYLPKGGVVAIDADSEDDDWQLREEAALEAQLRAKYGDNIVVCLGTVADGAFEESDDWDEDWEDWDGDAGDPTGSDRPYDSDDDAGDPTGSDRPHDSDDDADDDDDDDPTGSDRPYDSDDDDDDDDDWD